MCKFKVVKPSEPVLRCAHIVPASFAEAVLDMPLLMPCATNLGGGSPPLVGTDSCLSSEETCLSSDSEEDSNDGTGFKRFVQGSPCQLLASALAPGDAPDRILRSMRLLHENFSVHRLPAVVQCHQREVINAFHSACSARREAAHRMSFCVVCAINGKGFQSKLRMCSVTGALSCISCQPGTSHPPFFTYTVHC